jgi:hypothetical protein
MTEEHRVLWIRTILAMSGSEPQRRAFIDGYNGAAAAPHSSRQMLECHHLGGVVSGLLVGGGNG